MGDKKKPAVEKKRRKKAHHLHISTINRALHSLFTLLSQKSSGCKTLSSRLLRIIKRDVVYDNGVFRDEEKRTDDEYREELLFVF